MRHVQATVGSVVLALGGAAVSQAQCLSVEQVEFVSPNPGVAYQMGRGLAVDGTVAAVGESDNNPGRVHIFRFDGVAWPFEDTLTVATGGAFGSALGVSGDVLVAGAPLDGSIVSANGAVHVFRQEGGAWMPEAYLRLDDPVANDRLGTSVAVDGDTLVAGGRGPSNGAGLYSGRVIVYRYDGAAWSAFTELFASQPEDSDAFGIAVDIRGDLIVVGARHASPSFAGAAYVYRFTGNSWTEEQRLAGPGGYAHFGASVGVDGDTIVVGRPGDNVGSETGSADVYTYNGSQWVHTQELTPLNGDELDHFGVSVAIDGDVIIVGADQDDDLGAEAGAAYLYLRGGSTWHEAAKVTASDGMAADEFGESVAIGSGFALAGARLHDVGPQNEGAAYLFAGTGDCNETGMLDLCEVGAGQVDDANGNGLPDACECPADIDGDGQVGVTDFLALLAAWGPNPGHPADLDGDGDVGVTDFLALLAAWGPCP